MDSTDGGLRTKIVATLGPAPTDPEVLGAMVDAGLDVARLNFSHGDAEEHLGRLAAVRRPTAPRDALTDQTQGKVRFARQGGYLGADEVAGGGSSRHPGSGKGVKGVKGVKDPQKIPRMTLGHR